MTRWWLVSLKPALTTWDEFVVGDYRIRLDANSLEISFEGSGAGDEQALAERYVGALNTKLAVPVRLATDGEVMSQPSILTPAYRLAVSREERAHAYNAANEVRNELLADAGTDATLRRVYGYLWKTRERNGTIADSAIFDLYKVVEAIENKLGGRTKAGRILKRTTEIEAVHRAANDEAGDERHPPKDPAATPPRADIGQAIENTRSVVRAYEAYLRR